MKKINHLDQLKTLLELKQAVEYNMLALLKERNDTDDGRVAMRYDKYAYSITIGDKQFMIDINADSHTELEIFVDKLIENERL